MPHAIAVAAQAALYYVSGTIGGTAAAITGSTAIGGAVSTAVYYGLVYGSQTALSVALTAATMPRVEAAQQNFKQSDPRRMRAYGKVRLGGPLAFWEANGNWAADVVMIHDGKIDHFGQIYLNDDPVDIELDGDVVGLPNGAYPNGHVKISLREGLSTETVHDFIPAYFPSWTSGHRGDGIASIGMFLGHGKMDHFQERFPNGEPAVSAEVFAQLVFDPRDEDQDVSDPETWAWSDNAALCHLHWEFYDQGKAYDWEVVDDRLVKVFNAAKWNRIFAPNLAMWIEAADVADEEVPLKAGGTVKRYIVGAIYQEGQAPDAIRSQFLASYDGWMSQDGSGALTIYAGKYYAPTVTLGDDDVVDYTFQRYVEDEQSVNVLSLRYTEPSTGYTTAEPPPWRDEADIAARFGRERVESLELPWVQNASQCRRLAKRMMAKQLAFARGTIRTHMTDNALAALGNRYVQLEIGETTTLASLPVEIARAEVDLMNMSITYDWIAVDPDIDEWDAEAEEGEPASTEERPESEAVPVPILEDTGAVFDSVGGARLVVIFEDPEREDLTFVLRWKLSVEDAYSEEFFTEAEPAGPGLLQLKSGFVPADAMIDVSIAFVGGAGGRGEFATDEVVDTTTAALAPAAPTEVVAADGAGASLVSWRNPASSNLSYLKVAWNTSNTLVGATYSANLAPTGLSAPQSHNMTGVSAGTRWFWVLAYNAAAVASVAGGPDTATVS